MEKCRIYTRTGDEGTTSLVGGTRVPKTHKRLEAYGTIDELNSHMGLLHHYVNDPDIQAHIRHLQNTLFVVGAALASENTPEPFPEQEIICLEKDMDRMLDQLPEITHFILPGGCLAACQCHVCRTVCRRAERHIIALSRECAIDSHLMIFINRLSDYLYVLSRFLNLLDKKDEITWSKL